MEAKVKTQYKILTGIFDVGDTVVIERTLYEEDTILTFKWIEDGVFTSKDVGKYNTHVIGKPKFKKVEDVVAKKGSVKGWRTKSKNGNHYDDGCFRNAIGYKSLGEIFSKA